MIRLLEFEPLSKLNDLKAFKLKKTFSKTANIRNDVYSHICMSIVKGCVWKKIFHM